MNKVQKKTGDSTLKLANIEALAQGELLPAGVADIYYVIEPDQWGNPVHKYVCSGDGNRICPSNW